MIMMLQRLGDSDQVKFSSKGNELVYLHVYIASYTLPTERVFILDYWYFTHVLSMARRWSLLI